ncbi:hypothetical protein [Phenylobacterium sp.]|jgi:hypothetical protein|uniref:hypothetical protein n=1 Tax=Phenylobacterium sp. TaxID=1871053 RepID=UPI002F95E03D
MELGLFLTLYGVVVLWLAAGVAGSIIYRRRAGKPIVPKPPNGTTYLEKNASGASHRSPLTRLGGASNILMVAVTPAELIVRPKFPFNLMFLPEIWGLEHAVPRHAVQRAEAKSTWRGRVVLLEIRGKRRDETMELKLRDPDAFLKALRS